VQVEYAGIAAMARRLTQEKNASGVRTSYGHMVGYTWTSTHAAPIVLVRLISFAAGVSFMVSISCFLRNAGRRYIFSGTRLCNRRHRRCRRVFAPPLPPSPARLHPDSLGRLHALLLGKHEHHRLQSWAGANESIRVCPPWSPQSATFHPLSRHRRRRREVALHLFLR